MKSSGGGEFLGRGITHFFPHTCAFSKDHEEATLSSWKKLVNYTDNVVANARAFRPENREENVDDLFYSHVLISMPPPVTDEKNVYTAYITFKQNDFEIHYCPTLIAGGKQLLIPYHPNESIWWVDYPRMNARETRCIIYHELLHALYGHLARFMEWHRRRGKQEGPRRGLLADAIINGEEENPHLKHLPPRGVYRARGTEPFSIEDHILSDTPLEDIVNISKDDESMNIFDFFFEEYEEKAKALNELIRKDKALPYDTTDMGEWIHEGLKPEKLDAEEITPEDPRYREIVSIVRVMSIMDRKRSHRKELVYLTKDEDGQDREIRPEDIWNNHLSDGTKEILKNTDVVFCEHRLYGGCGGQGQGSCCVLELDDETIISQIPLADPSARKTTGLECDHGRGAEESEGDPDDVRQVARAKIEKAAQDIGYAPSRFDGIVEEALKSRFNWRTLLKSYLPGNSPCRNRSTYARRNRRLRGNRIMFPGHTIYGGDKILVMIDDSGSVSDYQLQQCVGEIEDITRQKELWYLMYDSEVHESIPGADPPYKYRRGDYKKIRVLGRGGTHVNSAFEYVQACREFGGGRWPEHVIIVTDGYDDSWPEEIPTEGVKFIVCIISATNDFPPTPEWAHRVEISLPLDEKD